MNHVGLAGLAKLIFVAFRRQTIGSFQLREVVLRAQHTHFLL